MRPLAGVYGLGRCVAPIVIDKSVFRRYPFLCVDDVLLLETWEALMRDQTLWIESYHTNYLCLRGNGAPAARRSSQC